MNKPTIVLMLAIGGAALGGAALAKGKAKTGLPDTPKKPVVDTYHGVTVTDDYRWLESGNEAAVKEWSAAENQVARAYLDSTPGLQEMRDRLRSLLTDRPPGYLDPQWRKGVLFARKYDRQKQQPLLVVFGADDMSGERALVDPNAIDPTGGTAIDWYVPSLDAKLVAVSLSQGGSEDGTLHVYDVATGKELGDVVPRVQYGTGGGSVGWSADGGGFYYTRYPHDGERPAADLNFFQQVWFHKIGSKPESDIYVTGKDYPRIAEIKLASTEDGKWTLASVANGDGGEFYHQLMGPGTKGKWVQLTQFSDAIVDAHFGRDDALYLLSHKDAPRGKVLRMPLATPSLAKAKVVIAEGTDTIEGFEPAKSKVYVVYNTGGPTEIRAFDTAGKGAGTAPAMPVSSIAVLARLDGDRIIYRNDGYLQPATWARWTAGAERAEPAAVKSGGADFSDAEVVRETATSKDGTKIPLNIIRRKGTKLDGKNPTVLYGYGGYGVSLAPAFDPTLRLWLDMGGVYVIANLRGGGEFGEEWHKAGALTRKQNVFDDFLACAQHLIDTKVTSPAKLAIEGGSNGGLLMGAALTQRPELFRAVVAHVGIFDMLRVENDDNGAFNVTEFGTVKDEAQFKALFAYSPYHNVKDKTAYPAILFNTGANDPRVNPYHSRKMVARLQAATSSKHPILLRTTDKSGHGIGSSLDELVALVADTDAFLARELGMKLPKGAKGKPGKTEKKATK
jgi:prolyl oligopeptidase